MSDLSSTSSCFHFCNLSRPFCSLPTNKNGGKMKLSSDHSSLLNVGLSVLIFIHQSKKTICWLASNFWILLGVMLEAGIDCAKIAQLTIEVGMSTLFVSVLQKMALSKLFIYLEGMMLKNERIVFPYKEMHPCDLRVQAIISKGHV